MRICKIYQTPEEVRTAIFADFDKYVELITSEDDILVSFTENTLKTPEKYIQYITPEETEKLRGSNFDAVQYTETLKLTEIAEHNLMELLN